MERFSWSDNLRAALAPCLACFHTRQDNDDEEQGQYNHHHATSNRGPDYVPRARADELEGLLADSDDAETLSLHSNIGRDDNRRRKRRRPRKGIRLFGFDLFGKPPIHLPEDDEVDARRARSRTISASTLDSDAAPLDPSMIDQLSATRLAEGEAQREAERLAKEERRRRRKEKKAARQAALALALEGNQDEFEGFPGSGPSYATSSDAPSSATYDYEEFGPFERGYPTHPITREDTEADGAADFGAEAYAKRPPRKGSSNGTCSDSQSRSSASRSRAGSVQFNHHYLSQAQMDSHIPPPSPGAPRRKHSSRHSISTASQSNSILSPPAHFTTFPAVVPHDRSPLAEEPVVADSQPIITIDTPNGFPTVGFSGGLRRKNSEAGVFLANRGDA